MSRAPIAIAGRPIGPGHPPYIVAEISGNHNGDIGRALAILDAAAEAGADAVKLQTYTADTITIDHGGPGFTIEGGLWHGRRLYDLYGEAYTPWDWHEKLYERGRKHGMAVFSTPFDDTAIEFLASLDSPAYKVASFEMIDLPLIRKIAAQGKPVIMSTGIADLIEIGEAVEAVHQGGCDDLILLHCVSGYPTAPKDANLLTIPHLAETFDAVGGLSDHTHGIAVSVAAIALGAHLIEKHVTLKRSDGGPDAAFSLEPDELKALVEGCRIAWEALGGVNYERKPSEAGNAQFRRSLYVVADVAKGEALSSRNVRSIRPGFGLAPKHLPGVLGRRATRNLTRGEPLAADMIEGGLPS